MEVEKIILRAVEPEDINMLLRWENDRTLWQYSNTITPFSRQTMEDFILNSSNDIYADKQLRLMIEDTDGRTVGCVDLFDFDPYHRRAAVGLLVDGEYQGRGYAKMALSEIIDFAFNVLELKQLYCDIGKSNLKTIRVFTRFGFEVTGEKRAWRRNNGGWEDYVFCQLIRYTK